MKLYGRSRDILDCQARNQKNPWEGCDQWTFLEEGKGLGFWGLVFCPRAGKKPKDWFDGSVFGFKVRGRYRTVYGASGLGVLGFRLKA